MIPNLPAYVPVFFGIALVATILVIFRIIRGAMIPGKNFVTVLTVGGVWLILQAVLSMKGVYTGHLKSMPPKLLVLGLLPALLTIAGVFASRAGRSFVDRMPLRQLTLLHGVRVPVEIALFGLYLAGAVPKLMTFEGGNLDILSGLSAPVVFYFAFSKVGRSKRTPLLVWNFVCLGLLANIVVRALGSAPFPLQRFAFDQPNIAILSFPFVWLPTFIVPVVLFSHLAAIRQLLRSRELAAMV